MSEQMARQRSMFGCTEAELRTMIEHPIFPAIDHGMTAMSILSDAQELLEQGVPPALDRARQYLNRAKWIIGTYLRPPRDVTRLDLTRQEREWLADIVAAAKGETMLLAANFGGDPQHPAHTIAAKIGTPAPRRRLDNTTNQQGSDA